MNGSELGPAKPVNPLQIPSWREMLSWLWDHVGGWVGEHPVQAVLLGVGLVVWYVGWVVRRAIQA